MLILMMTRAINTVFDTTKGARRFHCYKYLLVLIILLLALWHFQTSSLITAKSTLDNMLSYAGTSVPKNGTISLSSVSASAEEVTVEESSLPYPKPILPISFGLPEGQFQRLKYATKLNKTRDFAWIVPDKEHTYIYNTEGSYYDGYAEAYFGITFKKAGWDCFRHYEIIASGSMPYFMDIDLKPKNTMVDFPVHIVKEAMELPGVPMREQVGKHIKDASTTDSLNIDHTIFNITRYNELLVQLYDYSMKYLTWKAKATNMLADVRRYYPCIEK